MTEQATDTKAQETARRRALVKASPALQPYGTFEEVQELIRRFKVMLPETKDMTDDEVVALAQVAYIHGLNPLPAVREIIWLPGMGAMIGIRGFRRKGREYAEAHDLGLPFMDFILMTDAVEREVRQIPEGALAYKCVGGFPQARAQYVQDAKTLRDALGPEAPYTVILSTIGPMPQVTGWGYVTVEEMKRKDSPKWWHKCPKAGGKGVPHFGMAPCPDCGQTSFAQPPAFSHQQQAMKRAESHWWKQATDIPFSVTPSGSGVADLDEVPIFVEGQFKTIQPGDFAGVTPDQIESHLQQVADLEQHEAEQAAKSPEERKADAKAGSDALFGEPDTHEELTLPPHAVVTPDPNPRSWTAEQVAMAKKTWSANGVLGKEPADKHVLQLLNLSPFGTEVKASELLSWGEIYRSYRDGGSKTKEAALLATNKFFQSEGA